MNANTNTNEITDKANEITAIIDAQREEMPRQMRAVLELVAMRMNAYVACTDQVVDYITRGLRIESTLSEAVTAAARLEVAATIARLVVNAGEQGMDWNTIYTNVTKIATDHALSFSPSRSTNQITNMMSIEQGAEWANVARVAQQGGFVY